MDITHGFYYVFEVRVLLEAQMSGPMLRYKITM
jgi:hypothetical protein